MTRDTEERNYFKDRNYRLKWFNLLWLKGLNDKHRKEPSGKPPPEIPRETENDARNEIKQRRRRFNLIIGKSRIRQRREQGLFGR